MDHAGVAGGPAGAGINGFVLARMRRLRGALDEGAVKHAIALSEEKYCSVAAMLQKTAKVSWRYELLPAK